MKQLTPTWESIGVLIGIVVLGSILGRVTAQGAKCYPDAKGVTDPDEMDTIMDSTKKAARTCVSPNVKCLQYTPPATDGIKLQLTIECGVSCPASQADIDKKFLAIGYKCFADCNDGGSCKAVTDIKINSGKECYDYPMGKKLHKGETLPKKIFCVGGCYSLDYTGDTSSGTDTGPGVFMGCKNDCQKVKDNASITSGSNVCTVCGNLVTECKPKLIMAVGCWQPITTALTSVKSINEAMSNAKSHDCGSGNRCLQYLPPTDSNNRRGKVHLIIKCSSGSSDCPALPVQESGGVAYTCKPCARGEGGGNECKALSEITTGSTTCYAYSGEPKPDFTKIEKVYCMDKCQYSIGIDSSDKTIYFLGCASDCNSFKNGKKSATCTDCANDEECKRMGGDAPPKSPDGNNPNTGGTGATSPTNNQATTKPTKNCNEVTGGTYLIGCMAILIYAACHYMRQF